MRRPNKQDIIFIGEVLLYVIVTFIAYLFITQYFILENCPILNWIGGLGSMPHICFGYLKFFEKSSIHFYILFLWTTIVPFIRKKYLFPNNKLFIVGIGALILLIIYIEQLL